MKKRQMLLLTIGLLLMGGMQVQASPQVINGIEFDAEYYASRYPDVVTELGTDTMVLFAHYVNYGIAEGRSGAATKEEISQDMAEEMLPYINQVRSEAGIGGLSLNTTLCDVAYIRAKEMYDNNYFQHVRPDGSSIFDLIDYMAGDPQMAGENIALGQTSAEEVFTDWMNSDGHRANIMEYGYKNIGIARYGNYWVQIFTS